MIALVASCTEKETIQEEVVLDGIVCGFGMKSATIELELPLDKVSNAWYVYSPSEDTWLTHQIIPGEKSMWIMVDGNVTGAVRSSYIQVRCDNRTQRIVIDQDCEPTLELSASSVSMRYMECTRNVLVLNKDLVKDVKASISEEAASWCSATVRGDTIVVAAKENPTDQRRTAELVVSAVRSISGDSCRVVIPVQQDRFGESVAVEYSTDGGQTWLEEMPVGFSALKVRTNDGRPFSEDMLTQFKAIVTSAGTAAALDLSEALYDSDTFPAVFAGTSESPVLCLAGIKFPSNVTDIPEQAFINCKALKDVDLAGIRKIGAEAFRHCGIETLSIPNTVTSYGAYVFADNPSLKDVYYNTPFDPGSDKSNNMWTFYLEEMEIAEPQFVLTIGPDARYMPRTVLRHNNALVKIICEDAVFFRQYAFPYCDNLAEVEFRCTDEARIADNGVFGIASPWDSNMTLPGARVSDRRITVPAGLELAYSQNAVVKKLMEAGFTMDIPEVPAVPADVQYSTDGAEWTNDIPAAFTSLKVKANNSAKLTAFTLEEISKAIGAQSSPVSLDLSGLDFESEVFPAAFVGTESARFTKLGAILLPANIKQIPDESFKYCSGLKSVGLAGIVTIGNEAFRYCSLETLNVPNTVTQYGKYAFADNTTLREVYFNSPYDSGGKKESDGGVGDLFVFSVEDETAPAVLDFTFGPDATRVSRRFFSHCYCLKSLVFENLVIAHAYAFEACPYLERVEFKSTDSEGIADNVNTFCFTSAWGSKIETGSLSDERVIVVPDGLEDAYAASQPVKKLVEIGYTIQ